MSSIRCFKKQLSQRSKHPTRERVVARGPCPHQRLKFECCDSRSLPALLSPEVIREYPEGEMANVCSGTPGSEQIFEGRAGCMKGDFHART